MQIEMHSVHFDADEKLTEHITERLQKLELFHDRIIASEVFLRLEHDSTERENKVVEIKLNVRGKDLFAKKQSRTFEEAADQTVEALRKQLIKHKERVQKN
jgi:ribosome hibernation promoting factor